MTRVAFVICGDDDVILRKEFDIPAVPRVGDDVRPEVEQFGYELQVESVLHIISTAEIEVWIRTNCKRVIERLLAEGWENAGA